MLYFRSGSIHLHRVIIASLSSHFTSKRITDAFIGMARIRCYGQLYLVCFMVKEDIIANCLLKLFKS